jgi:hypothetical protein
VPPGPASPPPDITMNFRYLMELLQETILRHISPHPADPSRFPDRHPHRPAAPPIHPDLEATAPTAHPVTLHDVHSDSPRRLLHDRHGEYRRHRHVPTVGSCESLAGYVEH